MYLTKEKSSPYYQVVFFVDGRRNKKSTKCKLKSDALKFLSEFQKHLTAQRVVKNVMLSEFEKEYRNYVKLRLTQSSQDSIKYSFAMFTKSTGDHLLKKIDRRQVDIFINDTFCRSQSAAGLYYRTLKAAFNKALEWNYISENPFSKIKAPRIKEKLPIYINISQLDLINKQVEKQYLRDFYITAFYSGMRAGELCNLRWNAIDLEEKIIVVQNTEFFTTKSRRERIIPINETLYQVLKRNYPKVISYPQNEFVYWKVKGVKLNVDYVSKRFKKAVRKLGLDESIHLHVLRHSFASNLVQNGVDLYIVKELLGHSSISVTQKYSHLKRSNLFEAVNKLISKE